ncbi:MAG TPA: ABC transporter permease, partial [Alphaproteobacteria bacterium]|nr:ABC transporter permease [Alphaproteobacteria bacterium]
MADVTAPISPLDPARALGPSPTGRFFRRMRGHTSVMVGGSILLAIVLMAVFAPLLAPHDPYAQDLFNRLLPPFWMEGSNPAHLLGTDNLGRDYLSRLIYG